MAGTTLTRFPPKEGEDSSREPSGGGDGDRELGRDLRMLANALGEASRAFHRIATRYPGTDGRASARRSAVLSPVPSTFELPRPPTVWRRLDLRTVGLFVASLAVTFTAGVVSVRLLQSGVDESAASRVASPPAAPAAPANASPPPAPFIPSAVETAPGSIATKDVGGEHHAAAPAPPAIKRPSASAPRAPKALPSARAPAPAPRKAMTFDDDGVLEPSF